MKTRYVAIVAVLTLLLVIIAGCAPKAAAPVAGPAAPASAQPSAPAPAESAPAAKEEKAAAPAESESAEAAPLAESTLGSGADVTGQKLESRSSTGLAHDVSASTDVFSEVGCADGRITVKFTNTGDKAWSIVHKGEATKRGAVNVAIMNRGVVDVEPGCTAYDLEPKESVVCSAINMGAVVSGENRVSVNTPAGTVAKIVVCP
ncbi:hypothetical protein HY772_04050 [Candidatus Woesearchaeota archaeon]|nr:hypothetical protein [Candidatus Woesearchaeota archaeon]